jgi:transposase-like protein
MKTPIKDRAYWLQQLVKLRNEKMRIVEAIAQEAFGGLDNENREFCEMQHLQLCIKFQSWINENHPEQ